MTAEPIERFTTISLGHQRGHPRVWLEGKYLIRFGLTPGRKIAVEFADGHVLVRLDEQAGDRVVSAKRAGAVPVIDIANERLVESLAGAATLEVRATHGRLVIRPARIARLRASRRMTPRAVSIFSGGGLLSEAARQAGFEVVGAVEANEAYADIYQTNHPGAMWNCSIEQVDFCAMAAGGPVGLMEIGLPCEPFSAIRRLDRGGQKKRDASLVPEAHEFGDLVFWALKAIDAVNPHTIVCEEVPKFLDAGAGWIFRHALARMGYVVDARIVDPRDYGELTGRRRAVVVATSHERVEWPEPTPAARTMAEILEPVPEDSPLWFNRTTKPWLYEHWEKQTAKGNGFEPPKILPTDAYVGTIKKRYFAGQGDNQVVQHPTKPDHHRWFTLAEVRRLHGLPEHYELGDAKTTAGEAIGQGVVVGLFARLISSVTRIGTALARAA